MITLYDLTAKDPIKTWSPNPFKVVFVLNYKKIPFKMHFSEYPDLEGECKKVGIPPGGTKPDGSPLYTAPSITDNATGSAIADSYKIVEYLDKAYPTTPKVIPPGTEALQAAFYEHFYQLIAPVRPLLLPAIPKILNPPGAEYFIRTRTAMFGKPLDQVNPVGEARVEAFGKLRGAFDTLNGWLSRSPGQFFMGETITFADFVVASQLKAFKIVWGENSKEWEEVKTWNDGKWVEFLSNLEMYA